jgi:phosphatidylglycerol---prolipoprotein diacylglyceryl transferase
METILAAINWNPDPVAFDLLGRGVRWYGILLATGFLLGYLIMGRVLTKEGFKQQKVDIFAIYVIVGVVVGLRLGHCLFYNPVYYLSNPIEILKVWEGGLASHGGAVGILIAVWLFSRKNKIPYLHMLDRVVLIVPLAGGMVRLGNLVNSEIIGMPTNVNWAFIFERIDMIPRHPTQLYEAIFYFIMFISFYFMFMRMRKKWKDGVFLGWFLIVLFMFRFFIEFTKEFQVEFESYASAIKMGQWLSIPFVLFGIWLIWRGRGLREN